jgi:ATP adenylyltransferase
VDLLWSPWRYDYVKADELHVPQRSTGCTFCDILSNSVSDGQKYILHRAEFNFVILNIYPYISGHLMVIPYLHVAEIGDADKQTTDELMDLTKLSQAILRDVYKPNGFNVGMNIGKAAGAGVAEHIHMHVLPRWIGQTRTMPEPLDLTFEKLKSKFI